uniref:Ig-like domain-containing protein n=1 Tax=Paramormyrops kingsleyae TaxID=1676925 RepID=A0A3B3QEZ1_9TELE
MLLPWELLILLSLTKSLAVTQEPSDVIFLLDCGDSVVVFNCKAKGSPMASYRWEFNGEDIAIGSDSECRLTEGNLLINSPEPTRHGGIYQCIASNPPPRHHQQEGQSAQRARSLTNVQEGQTMALLSGPLRHWRYQDLRCFLSQKTGILYIAKVDASGVGIYTCAVRHLMTNSTVLGTPTPVFLSSDGQLLIVLTVLETVAQCCGYAECEQWMN